MEIRVATSAEDRARIFRLRYEVMAEELGWTIREADHETRQLSEPLDEHGILVGAFEGDEVLGALRINLARDGGLGPYEELYSIDRNPSFYPDRTAILTKLVAAREHRRSMVVPRLMLWVYGYGLRSGTVRAYLDCSLDLIPFYEKLGFVTYTDDVDTEEYGVIAPMRLDITDIEYLERIRSPFCRALTQFQQGHIDAYLESCGRLEADAIPQWPYGPDALAEDARVHVFDGLSQEDLTKVFRAATTRDFADGQAIFVQGDPSWEFGVILKGRAAVTHRVNGKERVLAMHSRGQVIGEMGFLRNVPRSATVAALGECQMAAFPSAVVEHLLKKEPGIAVHLFRNLSIILADRLAHANDWPAEVQ